MTATGIVGIALLLLVSLVVRVVPTTLGMARRLDPQSGALATLPQVVLVNLVAVCVLTELQTDFWPAAAGFGVAGGVLWRWPACNLLVAVGLAAGVYLAVSGCR